MILSENVIVKVCHQNYKYYEDKGYQITKELDKKNSLYAAYFYIAMRNYVKEIEKTRFKDSIDMDEK